MTGITMFSDDIRRAVERSFNEHDRSAAFEALSAARPAEHAGLLFRANGDAKLLKTLVELFDWRDFRDEYAKLDDEEIIRRREALGLWFSTHAEVRQMQAKRFEEEIFAFVAQATDFPRDQLTISTQLQRDLGIESADGTHFIQSFAKRFRVDLRGFNADDYFSPKLGEHPVSNFLQQIFRRGVSSVKTPITIGLLVKVANQLKWVSPTTDAS
jgi:hypothetical protein